MSTSSTPISNKQFTGSISAIKAPPTINPAQYNAPGALFTGGSSTGIQGIKLAPTPTGSVKNPLTGGGSINTYGQIPVVPQPQQKVSSDLLKSTSPITIPYAPDYTAQNTANSYVNTSVIESQKQITDYEKQLADTQKQNADLQNAAMKQPNQSQSIIDKLFGLNEQTSKRDEFQQDTQKEFDIYGKNQALNDVSNKILTTAQGYDEQIKKLQSNPQGLFGGALADEIKRLENEKTDKITSLNIQKAVAQGDVNTAISNIDLKVKAKFDPLEQQIKNLESLYPLVQNNLSESEKLDAQNMINTQKENLQTVQGAYSDVLKQAAEAGAPVEVLDAIDRAASKPGATPGSIYAAAGEYARQAATPANINSTVNSIAGAFDNEPTVKEYNTIKRNVDTFNNLGSSATDDIQRVYTFAKVADPNSAVKEGEYASIEKYSQALLQRVGLRTKRVFSATGILTPEARTAMQKTLETSLKASQRAYDNVASEYQRQIDDAYSGVNRQITNYSGSTSGSSGSSLYDF